jgi:subtilisin family serine protease
MNTVSKKPRLTIQPFFIASIFIVALFTIFVSSSVSTKGPPDQLKSGNGSIIRTSNPSETNKALQKYGLRSRAVTPLPGGKALITLQGPVSGLSAQLLKQELQNDADFKIFPNYTYRPALSPNDPLYTNNSQSNLTKINAGSAWDITTGSQDTTIAVIDSGVLFSQGWVDSTDCPIGTPCVQADFPSQKRWVNSGESGTIVSEGATPNCTSQGLALDKSCNNIDDDSNGFIDDWQGWDFMGGWRGDSAVCPNFASSATYASADFPNYISYDNDPQPYSCDSPTSQNELNRNHYNGTCLAFESACYVSHGTAVASVAAAATNNSAHIAGVDWNAKVMSVRALDGYGWGESAGITAAVEYATAMDADVINLSLAVFSGDDCTVTDTLLESALASAKAAGIVIVAAAGNGGTNGMCYPGRSAQVIGVGAATSNDSRASFSSYGSQLDVVAPGTAIPAALAPNEASGYATSTLNASGTSLATPHVAGIASLLVQAGPSLTPDEVRNIIIYSADKVPGMNGAQFTNEYGYGRINAYTSLRMASITHPDGTLIQASGDSKVYFIENGERRHVTSRQILESQRFVWDDIKKAVPQDMSMPTGTRLGFREGTLVQGSSDRVYIIDQDGAQQTKRHVTSASVLRNLGFSLAEVVKVADASLPVANGPSFSSATRHPDGTFIQASGDSRVYFIENGERRHVTSRQVIESYGFNLSMVKTATTGDNNLPRAAALSFREGTLVQGSTDRIYVINYNGSTVEKRHITSRLAFDLLGFKWDDILKVSDGQLPSANGASI